MALQYPTFYKPDPNKPQVYDANNNPVTLDQYLQATGQVGIPSNQINWTYVKLGNPADAHAEQSLKAAGFTDAQIASMPQDMKVGLATFWDVQQSNLNKGGTAANDINQQTFNEAMQAATNDPTIVQKYGEGLKTAVSSLQNNLGVLTGQYTQEQAANQRLFLKEQKDLADAAATAGQAYSGFRQKAKENLNSSQNDIIQSSRRQLGQSLQGLIQPFETRFGTQKLQETLGSANPGVQGEVLYNPVGNLQGTESLAKNSEILNKAQSLYPVGLNPAK